MSTVHAIGRRKSSVARVYLSAGDGTITINKKDSKEYFPTATLLYKINQPLKIVEMDGKLNINVSVNGGGNTGQAEAIRMAISRALCEMDIVNRPALKADGMLTRDSRVVERKKPGQKKARKRFQWVKR